MQYQLPKFFLDAPHTSTSLDADTGQWIVIRPRLNQCWLISTDQWRCIRFNINEEDIPNAIQETQ